MKKELIERGNKAIDKRIDVGFLIQKLVEIEKLKVLLLNEDQLQLFEYLPKPMLTNNKLQKLFSKKFFLNKVLDEKKKYSPNYFQEKWNQLDLKRSKSTVINKVYSVSESYKKIKAKQTENASELDQKLLDMLDSNIKNMLEKKDSPLLIKNNLKFAANPSHILKEKDSKLLKQHNGIILFNDAIQKTIERDQDESQESITPIEKALELFKKSTIKEVGKAQLEKIKEDCEEVKENDSISDKIQGKLKTLSTIFKFLTKDYDESIQNNE